MPNTFIEPFDLKTIFMNYFLGSQELFFFFFIIAFSFSAAYLRIPNKVFLILLAIGSIMFSAFIGESIYVFVLFMVGFVSFLSFSKIFR